MIDIIILGVIQGITEWLPVSSSAQLILFMTTVMNMNFEQAMQMMIVLHAGTTLAAIVYFRKDIITLIKEVPKQIKQKDSLLHFLIISTLITGLLGLGVYQLVKKANILPTFVLVILIGVFLIFTGILQKYSKSKKVKSVKKIRLADAVVLGIVQAFSIIPGISRSGITTATLLFRRFDNHAALKLSFLMSIPVIIGAEFGLNLTEKIIIPINALIAGVLSSFIVGLLTIGVLMKFANKVNFSKFCMTLGVIAILFGILGVFL